jgi:ERCC4-type nuclease
MTMLYKFLVDSREQKPYNFKGEIIETCALKTGDYSIAVNGTSYQDEIIIERKSLDDFVGMCYGPNRDRFLKELERSLEIPHFYVMIEADWQDIEKHSYYSKINPNSIIECILGWSLKYGVNFIMGGNRTRSERLTKKLLLHYLKYKTNNKKEKKKDLIQPLHNADEVSCLI